MAWRERDGRKETKIETTKEKVVHIVAFEEILTPFETFTFNVPLPKSTIKTSNALENYVGHFQHKT